MNNSRIKKVVVVYGPANTGKTTALRELCENLINRKTGKGIFLQRKGAKKRLMSMPPQHSDIMCAVHCMDNSKKKEVLVGIASAGDDWESVERNFMFFDSVFPEDEFACVFIAVRRQTRQDGLGVAEKSFPLMALERKEADGLRGVVRPFVPAPNIYGPPKTGPSVFRQNCCKLAIQLESMI